MTVTIEIPDDLASVLGGTGKELANAALEAIALEGYRSDRLSEADIGQLLGFETRMEVHAFLKDHRVSCLTQKGTLCRTLQLRTGWRGVCAKRVE